MTTVTEAVMQNVPAVKNLGKFELPDPDYGDLKLNVFPIVNDGGYVDLPNAFRDFEDSLNKILSLIPVMEDKKMNIHYVTIDSKFFSTDGFLRREGIHIDGNFCADPNFASATWGGTRATWCGIGLDSKLQITRDWEAEWPVEIEIGSYVSSDLGGMFVVSSEVGCCYWDHSYKSEIGDGGQLQDVSEFPEESSKLCEKNQLYFLTSNTPHASLNVSKGTRRTFMRLTLNHRYPNSRLLL